MEVINTFLLHLHISETIKKTIKFKMWNLATFHILQFRVQNLYSKIYSIASLWMLARIFRSVLRQVHNRVVSRVRLRDEEDKEIRVKQYFPFLR